MPMTLQTSIDRRAILARLDAIMRELELLRNQLDEPSVPAVPAQQEKKVSVTAILWGAAGTGTREEYDFDLDWQRFGRE